jgi:hypothetical protein
MGCLLSSVSDFFVMGHFDWPIIKKTKKKKKLNLEMLSQNSSFNVRIECLLFGSTMYVRCEKGRTLGKGYGINKLRCD